MASSPPATLVFDEVDAGIGGAVAEIVGRRMRDLGERCQVLAVTHLPQVAALAHQQVRVLRVDEDATRRSEARALTAEERIEELARMLRGLEIGRETREHAREMLRAGQAARPPRRPRRPAA